MPQVLIPVFVKAYIVVATILAKGGFAAFLVRFAAVQLLSTLTSKLFGPEAPKPAGFSGLQVMTRSAIEYRKIIYGQAIVSGPIYYNNVSGTDNEYLWYGIALAEGESDDLVSVLFDNDVIPKADIDWAAGTGASDGTGTGDVSTSRWIGDNSTNAVQIYYYLGDDLQPVSGDLNTAFADIGTNDRLRGVTHLIVQLLYNEDTENVWKSGPPNNIRAVINGRQIYDPRLDTTNGGTGSHRYTDSTTWAWSENPALCVADYLMEIMGVDPATSIDWTAVADTADDCEVSVAIPTASTEDRFTCNGALTLGSSHKDNLDAILSSMDGKLSYSGGVWKVRASVWESSSVTITESDMAGDIDVRGSAPKSERFSTIRGFFIDPDRNYEAAEFPHISDSTYLTRDNSEVITYDLQLPMTNTVTMAQRIAMRNLEQGNNQIVAKLKMNARGSKVAIGDVVDFTLASLSWTAKTFRCIEWVRNPDSTYSIAIKEDNLGSYTDPIEADYGSGNTGGVTLPSDVVPAPSGLSAAGVAGGIELSWTNPSAAEYDFIEIYEDTDNSWAGAAKIAEVRADTITIPHDSGAQRYYWIRAIRLPDLTSIRNPDSDTTTITATATAGADGTAGSSALNSGRRATDLRLWWSNNTQTTVLASPWSVQSITGPIWPTVIGATENVTTSRDVFSERVAIVSGKKYRVAIEARQPIGDRTNYLLVAFYDSAGDLINNSSTPVSDATGWTTIGTYHYWDISNSVFPTTWTRYERDFGGDASTTIPTGAVTMAIGGLFIRAGAIGTNTTVEWQDLHIVEVGESGTDAVTSQLTNPSPIVPADNDGTNPVYTNAGGTHKVYEGSTDETTNATHSISGSATLNGLTIAVVSGTGVYSFSGASWSTDQEQFTLRAAFGGINYDKLITVTKAMAEAGSARITPIGAFAVDIALDPDDGQAALQVNSDGDVYSRAGLGSSFSSVGTYLGTGVVADYDVMFEGTGNTPTGSAVNSWLPCNATQTWTHNETVNGNTEVFTGTLIWRDDTTFEILGQASAAVQAQVTS